LGIAQGSGAGDQWDNAQGGFRLDWGSGKEQQTLQGDVYQGVENVQRYLPTTTPGPTTITSGYIPAFQGTASFNPVNDTDHVSGMNILGRLTHEINTGSDVTLQGYYDDVNRELDFLGSSLHTQTFDIDFQHNLAIGERNDITWGLGYRFINSVWGNSFLISYNPENYYESVYSGFLQDKITLIEDKLFFTIGSKLEHNDFSGYEWEPSVRLAWTPTANQTVWAAVSRAVRTPNQTDQNINLVAYATPGFAATEQGQASATANVVTTYEMGYRIQPKENISLDIAGFVNEYKRLDSSSTGTPYFDSFGNEYFPSLNTNNSSGESQGIEVAATWEATKYLKLSAGYTLYYSAEDVVGTPVGVTALNGPNQQFNLRSYVDLPHNVQWDTMLYTVEALPYVVDQYGNVGIPGYARLDTRLGWTPITGLDLSLIGQNLLQSEHVEYSPALYQTPEEIGRSVLAKATFRF
jgi:iron complex outermembrane receptor protein